MGARLQENNRWPEKMGVLVMVHHRIFGLESMLWYSEYWCIFLQDQFLVLVLMRKLIRRVNPYYAETFLTIKLIWVTGDTNSITLGYAKDFKVGHIVILKNWIWSTKVDMMCFSPETRPVLETSAIPDQTSRAKNRVFLKLVLQRSTW